MESLHTKYWTILKMPEIMLKSLGSVFLCSRDRIIYYIYSNLQWYGRLGPSKSISSFSSPLSSKLIRAGGGNGRHAICVIFGRQDRLQKVGGILLHCAPNRKMHAGGN